MTNALLENWVSEYTDELYRWAYHKTSSTEMAEDLVQDTFLAAAEKIGSFRGDSSPKTWLFSILNFKIIDYYRVKINQPLKFEDNSLENYFDEGGDWHENKKPTNWLTEDGHLLDDIDFQGVLKMCLDALPEKWSMSVKLKYLSEKSSDEICQELGIATTNFWQIVHRAKLQLRNCIQKNWFEN
ncbi:MAG: sigma-70 family RNA polymerase sigma factor [Paludibacter sp.]|nr:sigma-70 family RNA polymerase sigma factor [Paludibacter sp.]